ncbi:AAA family ATPase [Hymenobacter psoromatis]|uniref:AAA family ATPase n=1 Tax=Hymenobacter psoromatis TaxID=1484116 RepID=UPI001CC0DB9E|nr:AAA family ATPase [Hymenobacter psoromatis]
MLKRLHLQNFTVFADADFEFGPGLNVLVGNNGTGKSHVLKVGYAMLETLANLSKGKVDAFELDWSTQNFRTYLSENLKGVFQPERNELGKLSRWEAQKVTSIIAEFSNINQLQMSVVLPFQDSSLQVVQVQSIGNQPKPDEVENPLFIPAKEVLTLAWISRLDERYKLPIDITYLNLLSSLKPLALKQPKKAAAESLVKLEDLSTWHELVYDKRKSC